MSSTELLHNHWRIDEQVSPADTLLVHSNLFPSLMLLKRNGFGATPELVLEALMAAVPDGTLLFPTFNFDFAKGLPYDVTRSPSQMGQLTELARQDDRFIRTRHPLYSFAVTGLHADKFAKLQNKSGLGIGSPFDLLHELDGKIAMIDIKTEECLTFVHYVEERNQVPYRYMKDFAGSYSADGHNFSEAVFSMFVRDIENGVETDISVLAHLLSDRQDFVGTGAYSGRGMGTLKATQLYSSVSEIINTGRAEGMLFQRAD